MTISNSYNAQGSIITTLPTGSNIGAMAGRSVLAGAGLGIGQVQQSGLTVKSPSGDDIITFHTDGRIETKGGTIQARDLTAVIKLMKRMVTDIANDEELAKKFPYIRDAAHEWVIDELRK